MLEIQDLHVSRGRTKVLRGVNLTLEKGTPFALMGQSGSGKTTLLLCATGLLDPDHGRVLIQGKEVHGIPREERSRLIGLVFQDYQLFPHLTVLENALLAPRLQKLTSVSEASARSLLEQLGIAALADRYPHELSGGQRQRVAIARALLLEPKILFLDEPTAALDESTTRELGTLLENLNQKSQVVVVSHDREFVQEFCPRVARMENGSLIQR